MARRLAEASVRVDRIEHSGLTRAEETAEILAEAVGGTVSATEGIGSSDDVVPVAGRLGSAGVDSLMLVGHVPFMERLGAYLLAGDAEAEILHFRTAAVACLSREGNGWTLEWFLPPDLA